MSITAADYLVHLSNVLLLIAFSVRDILLLRWFAVAAAAINIPYYLFQPNVLWPPVCWAVVFMLINLYQIWRIYWERRPIIFSDEEQTLYDLGFRAVKPRDFVALVAAGEWRDGAAGEQLLVTGQPVQGLCVAISGVVQVRRQDRKIGELRPGQIMGIALAMLGTASPVDAVFDGPTRYIYWPLGQIRVFLDKKPELRATLQELANRELARKIYSIISD